MTSNTRKSAQHAVKKITIKTDYYKDAIAYIDDLIASGDTPFPKVGFLLGKSGHGKTKICDVLKNKYPNEVSQELTIKPLIYISLLPDASIGDLWKSLYFALQGVAMPAKGTNGDRLDRVVEKLKAMQVKLIVIDEAQHAVKGTTNEHGRTGAFINTLKTLLDNSGIPILVVGLPTLKHLRSLDTKNEDFSKQLRRRSFTPCQLHSFSLQETKVAIEHFEKKLKEYGVKCNPINNSMFIVRMFLCSGGSIGDIADLIINAITEEGGGLCITEDSIKRTASLTFDDDINMFDKTDTVVKKLLKESQKEKKS